jgi:hypothetical protein
MQALIIGMGCKAKNKRHSGRSGKIFERSRPPENQMTAPKDACSESPLEKWPDADVLRPFFLGGWRQK